jgi:hypothetical protein
MEVSRIEAAPTKIIDWRRLTAKEIIKYNNDGVEVPPQYLKWAIDFRQDLEKNDKDDITYEMAEKQKIEDAKKEEPVEAETVNNERPAEIASNTDNETDPENAPAQDVNNKTPAEQKREDMENSGEGLRKIAITFIKDSKNANKEDIAAAAEIKNAQNSSTKEIETLEAEMSTIISRAQSVQDDLKNEIDSINSGKSNKLTFAKINRLQQKLQMYGQNGQTKLASAEGDFTVYEKNINDKEGIILNAADFGSETEDIGHKLLSTLGQHPLWLLPDTIIGKSAEIVGNHTNRNAIKTEEVKDESNRINQGNKSRVSELKSSVYDATGVEGYSATADGEQAKEDKEKIKTQTAAATETDKAASASLDQVLLAKLRRGQDVEA